MERLFKNDASLETAMENFAQALDANADDKCKISYTSSSPYGNALVVSFAGNKITESMPVAIQLSEKYEFTAEFQDKESIGIIVHFDDFDQIYSDFDQTIEQGAIITAYEIPFIENFAINFPWEAFENIEKIEDPEKHPNVVPNGEKGKITWDLGNIEKAEAHLYDEEGILLTKISPYEIEIDKNREFKLNVEQNGKTTSQLLEVKDAPYIVDFHVEDEDGNKNKVMPISTRSKILWNIRCAENISTCLYDEKGNEFKYTPDEGYIVEIRDRKLTLKVKKEDIVVSKDLTIRRTLWEKINFYSPIQPLPVDLLANASEKGYNYFFYAHNIKYESDHRHGYIIYTHPRLSISQSCSEAHGIDEWEKLAEYDSCPENFTYYNCFLNNDIFTICYTTNDKKVTVRNYNLNNGTWDDVVTICDDDMQVIKDAENLYGTLQFCHYAFYDYKIGSSDAKKCIFAVYESSIIIYELNHDNRLNAYNWKVELPPTTKSFKIVSIDVKVVNSDLGILLLAVLLNEEHDDKSEDSGHVFVYEVNKIIEKKETGLQYNFQFNRIDQKRVYLNINWDFSLVVLDNLVFPLISDSEPDLKEIYTDINFSPKETILDKNKGIMIIGPRNDRSNGVCAIVQNNDKTTYWDYQSI